MTIYIETTIHCVALSNDDDDENSDFQGGKTSCAMTQNHSVHILAGVHCKRHDVPVIVTQYHSNLIVSSTNLFHFRI